MNQTLYDYLKEKVFEQNMTLMQLSRKSGLSHVTIYRCKDKKPSVHTYHKLANALDVDVVELSKYPITID